MFLYFLKNIYLSLFQDTKLFYPVVTSRWIWISKIVECTMILVETNPDIFYIKDDIKNL